MMSHSLFHKRSQKSDRSSSHNPRPPVHTFPPPPPLQPRSPPPPRSTVPSMPPAPHPSESLAKAIMEGFVFGTGSALAREAVNRSLAQMPVGVKPERKKCPCELIETQIQECMSKVSNHGNFCSDLFEKYIQQCASQNTNP